MTRGELCNQFVIVRNTVFIIYDYFKYIKLLKHVFKNNKRIQILLSQKQFLKLLLIRLIDISN